MDTSIFVALGLLLLMLALTVPVYLALFATGVIGLVFLSNSMLAFDVQALQLVDAFYKSMDKFPLVVVLFFILCGNIMTSGSIVSKLIKVAKAVVGFFPGGLGMAGILACGLFGAISGSTVATVVAIGSFMIPALVAEGYNEKYAVGVMTTSPILGVVIPPSISMILYAMISNDSLEALFMTGFVPGVLIILSFCIYTYVVCKRDGMKMQKVIPVGEFLKIMREGMWALLLPLLIFGGIFSGVFTANEAAVIACVYAFIVEIFIHKDMSFRQAKKVIVSSAVTSATLLIIVAGATVFGKYLTVERIPEMLTEAVTASISSKVMFLLVMNVFLLIVGMFMDIISATMILTPVFLPMLYQFEINTLHFGLLMTINLGIGYVTPPMGVSLYITGAVADRDLIYVTKAVAPFIFIQLAILAALTYWPDVVLFLPKIFYPGAF
ncbi:MAG: C4-dicarboxylate ABC transporter permease [Deltaproteobacteria bacterium]|nr:MAG: C4-dicarboxylate ABC transporter permease [Deltaproteobacteria bacterium]